MRSAQSARSYEGMESVANPMAARRSWSTWVEHGYSITGSASFLDLHQDLHAARCVACHGVRSHAVPVAFVGKCSMPVV